MKPLPSEQRRAHILASYLKYHEKNKEKRRQQARARYLKNKERHRVRSRAKYLANREAILARCKSNYQKNKTLKAEQQRKRLKQPAALARHRGLCARWAAANREKMRAFYRKAYHKGMKDPKVAMGFRLRVRLAGVFRRLKATPKKAASTMALVGCSREQLVAHIESQFKRGMTWENRSAWHLDHIRPISSFDLLDPEQQRECFHFSNLQPLWRQENLEKSDKVIPFEVAA